MDANTREVIKTLIEISTDVDEADKVINDHYHFKSISEKVAFLKGMFDVKVIHQHDSTEITEEESAEMTYWSMLDTIINT